MKIKYLLNISFLFILCIIIISPAQSVEFKLEKNKTILYPNNEANITLFFSNNLNVSVDGKLVIQLSKVNNALNLSDTNVTYRNYNVNLPPGNSTLNFDIANSSKQALIFVNLKLIIQNRVITLNETAEIYFISKDSGFSKEDRKEFIGSPKGEGNVQFEHRAYVNHLIESQRTTINTAIDKKFLNTLNKQNIIKEFEYHALNHPNISAIINSLINSGFKEKSSTFNPSSNISGSFSIVYESQEELKIIMGEIKNETLNDLNIASNFKIDYFVNKVLINDTYIFIQEELKSEGFKRHHTDSMNFLDKSEIQFYFLHPNNKSAAIVAKFSDGKVSNIYLDDNKFEDGIELLVFLILIGLAGYFLSVWSKNNSSVDRDKKSRLSEAMRLVDESKKEYSMDNKNIAFMLLARSIKLILKTKYGTYKEMTDREIISLLNPEKNDIDKISNYLDTCSLVAFARFKVDTGIYDEIMEYCIKISK